MKSKMLFTFFKSLFVPEIFKFLKYANKPSDDVIDSTPLLIKYDQKGYLSQFVSEMFDSLQ